MTTPLWLSGSLRPFLFSSSMCSCHVLLIPSTSVIPCHFCPLLCPSLHEMLPCYLQFEEISCLFHSIVFLFLCIIHQRGLSYLFLLFFGGLHSVGYIFPFLFCLLLVFFSQVFVKSPQTTSLPSCISFSLGCLLYNV